jgi:hypothetical protein
MLQSDDIFLFFYLPILPPRLLRLSNAVRTLPLRIRLFLPISQIFSPIPLLPLPRTNIPLGTHNFYPYYSTQATLLSLEIIYNTKWRYILCFARLCESRVARWYIFKLKIPVWVNFGMSCNDIGIFYGHLIYIFIGYWVYFMAIRYILWSFCPVWYGVNLAALGKSSIFTVCAHCAIAFFSFYWSLFFTEPTKTFYTRMTKKDLQRSSPQRSSPI